MAEVRHPIDQEDISNVSSNSDSESLPPKTKVKRVANFDHLFWWEAHKDCGFPNRVNHASATYATPTGSHGVISVGGYHAEVKKRLEWRLSYEREFHSVPIDVFKLNHEERTWTEVEQMKEMKTSFQCPTPRCRYGHTVCHFDGKLFMYGGRNDDDLSFKVVECYDIVDNIWFKISLPFGPDGLCGQAACVLGKVMYVHGGYSEKENQFSTSLWTFDFETRTWTKVEDPEEDVVSGRDFHTITPVGHSLYLFGGRSDLLAPLFSGRSVYDANFYQFDTKTRNWSTLNTTGYQPSGRRSHVAEPYGHYVMFFGGYNAHSKNHYGDLFLLNTLDNHIREVRPWGDFPSPRRRMSSARIGSEFIIFGGTHSIKVDVDGRSVMELEDLADMYILKLLPTLQQLCMLSVIKHSLPRDRLPQVLKDNIVSLETLADKRDSMLLVDETVKYPPFYGIF
jgi:hypothetical protein